MANRDLQRLCEAVEFPEAPQTPVLSMRERERQAIHAALKATQGQRGRAAGLLGVSRTTLFRRMKQYGIE
jgi:transcriptional activator for dhaKLM operon